MRTRFWAVLALVALVSSGCVLARSLGTSRRCSDTPHNAIATFLQGVTERSLTLLYSVIPEGFHVLAIFGGGSVERGRELVRQMVDHPEVRRGNEVDNVYHLVAVRGSGEEREVTIERRVEIIHMGRDDAMRLTNETYERDFLVRVDPDKNCILAVSALDPEWRRTD